MLLHEYDICSQFQFPWDQSSRTMDAVKSSPQRDASQVGQIVVRHGAVEQHGRHVALVSPAGVMFHMSDTQACACARLRARRTNETLIVHVCTRTCVLHRRNISPPASPAQAAAPHRPQLQPAADPEADLPVCARTCVHAVL